MRRKLIKQGVSGYTIYVPKKWIDENKLEKGDELDVTISGKDLIISIKPNQKKSETSIKITNIVESSIRTLITNAYRSGYDRIKISFNFAEQFQILQKTIKTKLIGFDIIKKEANSCIVENITEPSYDQFDNLLKKMFLNIEELFNITKIRLTKTKEELEDFQEVEERIQKYDNFCRRVISKQKLIKQHSESFWTFLSIVVHAQRELVHLNEFISKNKIVISKQTLEIFGQAYEIYKLIEKAYYEKDIDLLSEVHEKEKDLTYKKGYSLLQTKKGKEAIIISHLLNCGRQFYLSSSPLTGLIV
ncbi:MAG: hypothetical protein ABIE22_02405 [archaeon]